MSLSVHLAGKLAIRGHNAEQDAWAIREYTVSNQKKFESVWRLTGREPRDVPRTIPLWERTADGGLLLPRTALESLRAEFWDFEGADVDDRRVTPPLPAPVHFRGELNPAQVRFAQALLWAGSGTGVMPTGGGKTVVALSLVAQLQLCAFVLVCNLLLAKQWARVIREFLDVECGMVAAGRRDLRPITVGTLQSLARRPLTPAEAERFGIVITDEGHRLPALQWLKVDPQFPALHHWAFTATPDRKDGLQPILFKGVGPIVARAERSECSDGRIVPFDVESIDTEFELSGPAQKWTTAVDALSADPTRNRQIAEVARKHCLAGSYCLILVDRVDHCRTLAQDLADLAPLVVHGKLSDAERETAGNRLRTSPPPLTIAMTAIAGEGLDAPRIDVLIVAAPNNNEALTTQMVGRVTRAAPGKGRALIVDFNDRRVPMFATAARLRRRVYQGLAR